MGALANLTVVLAAQLWTMRDYLRSGLPGRVPRPPLNGEILLALGLTIGICALSTLLPYAYARRKVARLEF